MTTDRHIAAAPPAPSAGTALASTKLGGEIVGCNLIVGADVVSVVAPTLLYVDHVTR